MAHYWQALGIETDGSYYVAMMVQNQNLLTLPDYLIGLRRLCMFLIYLFFLPLQYLISSRPARFQDN